MKLVVRPSKLIRPNTLLLVRMDAIGDYILFRNFIEFLSESEKYKNYHITLVGDCAWKELAEFLDARFVDEFIWIEKKRFKDNCIYRYRMLKKITALAYEVTVNPLYSREFFCGDTIVNFVCAKKKIGRYGDLSNIRKWQKKRSDNYYTDLLPGSRGILFEFFRNKEFFELMLEKTINISVPYIELPETEKPVELPLTHYVLLFLGASNRQRKWSVEKFAKLADYLKKAYGYQVIICGSSSEIHEAKKFSKFFEGHFVDKVGKTSLIELLYLIKGAELLISNETMAPHMAVAVKSKNIFVISNGNHYGRFTPYPKEITENYYPMWHPCIEKERDDDEKLRNTYGYGSTLEIDDIEVQCVISKVDSVLNRATSQSGT